VSDVSNKMRLCVFTKDQITPYQFDKVIAITWGILISSASSGPVHSLHATLVAPARLRVPLPCPVEDPQSLQNSESLQRRTQVQ
jgi:hypothetical protein